jgi:hypothetical protein
METIAARTEMFDSPATDCIPREMTVLDRDVGTVAAIADIDSEDWELEVGWVAQIPVGIVVLQLELVLYFDIHPDCQIDTLSVMYLIVVAAQPEMESIVGS